MLGRDFMSVYKNPPEFVFIVITAPYSEKKVLKFIKWNKMFKEIQYFLDTIHDPGISKAKD